MGLLAPAGQAAAPAFITFNPTLASFGKTPVGGSTTETFTLKNGGGSSTGALSIALLGSSTFKVTVDHCTGVNLGPTGTCSVTVVYRPTAVGATSATTLWAYGAKPAVVAVALMSGTGSAAPSADLGVTNTDGVTSVVAGTSTTYTIVVSNHGPSAVTGASVADAMPSAIKSDTYTAVATGGATGFAASGSGSINDTVNMPSGSTITYTVVASVRSSATGPLVDSATVTAPAGVTDPNPANNSATDTDSIAQSADLSITNTDGVTSVVAGTSTTYTIVVTNNGPSDVNGVSVVDSGGASYSAVGSSGASGFTASGSGSINDSGISMTAGSTITYTVHANVPSAATVSFSNTATVTAPAGVDPNPANNSATDTDSITQSADLSVTKTDSGGGSSVSGTQGSVVAGNSTTYTIVVTNNGPSDLSGASVEDAMPSVLSDVSYTAIGSGGASGFTTSGSGNIDDTNITMPSGATVTYTVSATVKSSATGPLSNTATVTEPEGVSDPNPSNNSATDTDTVTRSADLSITKADAVSSVVAGESTTYTISVTNNGPSDVTGVSVTDAMPSAIGGDTYTAVGSSGASGLTAAGGTLSAPSNIDDTNISMTSGSTITYTVVANVKSSATGTLSNTATVTAPADVDPNSANNSATDTDTITRSADLSITKTDGVTSILPGGQTTYTIVVTNNGPSDVSGVSVADAMPSTISGDSYTAVESTGATGATPSGSGNINDTAISMTSGSTITYTVTATVSSTATPTLSLSNTATVTAPADVDPNPSNNSATDTDTIGAVASCTSSCSVNTGSTDTGALNVIATGPTGTTGTVQAAVFTGALSCTYTAPELNLDPNTYEVIASTSAFSKTVAIEFPAPSNAPKIDTSDTDGFAHNDGDQDYDDVLWNVQICFQATYSFTVKGGGTATQDPSTGLYTGLLPDCPTPLSSATSPCDERSPSRPTNVGADGTTNYDINETVFIPAGLSGDPRMN